MVALNLGLAALVIWGARLKDAVMKRELVVALVASVAVVATLGPGYINAQLTAFNHAEVLELRESKDATFVVLGYDMDGPEPFVQLLANPEHRRGVRQRDSGEEPSSTDQNHCGWVLAMPTTR